MHVPKTELMPNPLSVADIACVCVERFQYSCLFFVRNFPCDDKTQNIFYLFTIEEDEQSDDGVVFIYQVPLLLVHHISCCMGYHEIFRSLLRATI